MKRAMAWALAVLTLGCATMGAWEPVLDRQGDPHPENIDRDLEQCRRLARQASGDSGQEAAKGAGVGAAGGAAIGAMLGAIGGGVGQTAAAGAVIGGAGGAASQGLGSSEQFKSAYTKCMQGRGHRVIN
ncbi:MAG TPA: hypothetical protein VNI01_05280 [Elusimicrobiota bacterium]|jgi:hypothetical protein|nr:hypothetical protein [Elusimicrobiota bacterium]